jgi:hypothetical protein
MSYYRLIIVFYAKGLFFETLLHKKGREIPLRQHRSNPRVVKKARSNGSLCAFNPAPGQ